MAFKYACFISYRHTEGELVQGFTEDLRRALRDELAVYFDGDVVFLDKNRLQGGEFFNKTLATDLCQSVCMILVFTPRYFNKDNTYCAREYKAMELLERNRLHLLDLDNQRFGLIIPIVLRGADSLPEEIKGYRQCYYFDDFTLCCEINKHPKYAEEIQKIANYIVERCWQFGDLSEKHDLCRCCENFSLPPDEEILEVIDSLAPKRRTPFPRL